MSAKGEKWYFMPFLYDDWLGSEQVRLMPLEARGLYIDCLACQWKNGSIPGDIGELWRLIGSREEDIRSAWPFITSLFVPVDREPGRVYNIRLEEIRADQKAYQKERSEHGRKGAAARWAESKNEQCPSIPPAMPEHSASNAIKEKKKREKKSLSPAETIVVADPAEASGPYGIAWRVLLAARAALELEPPIEQDIKRELRKAGPLQTLVSMYGEDQAARMFVWAYNNWNNGATWSGVLSQRDRVIAGMEGRSPKANNSKVEGDFLTILSAFEDKRAAS